MYELAADRAAAVTADLAACAVADDPEVCMTGRAGRWPDGEVCRYTGASGGPDETLLPVVAAAALASTLPAVAVGLRCLYRYRPWQPHSGGSFHRPGETRQITDDAEWLKVAQFIALEHSRRRSEQSAAHPPPLHLPPVASPAPPAPEPPDVPVLEEATDQHDQAAADPGVSASRYTLLAFVAYQSGAVRRQDEPTAEHTAAGIGPPLQHARGPLAEWTHSDAYGQGAVGGYNTTGVSTTWRQDLTAQADQVLADAAEQWPNNPAFPEAVDQLYEDALT